MTVTLRVSSGVEGLQVTNPHHRQQDPAVNDPVLLRMCTVARPAGTVEYRVRHPNRCGLEVSATGAFGPGADPTAGFCTASPQLRTGVGYGGHPAGGVAAGCPCEPVESSPY